MFFGRVLGGASGKFRGFNCIHLAGRGVPGKGRIGVSETPIERDVVCRIEKGEVVGLKKDCG